MTLTTMLSWVALVFAFLAQILIIFKKKSAFIMWNIGSLICLGLAMHENNLPQGLLFLTYVLFDTVAYIMWRRAEKSGTR